MKKTWAMLILVMILAFSVMPSSATRREGISGFVENVDSEKITVASKTYRMHKQFRVVVVTREGIHRYERDGRKSDVRVGDKVSAVVLYDEMTDIYLERY